jgi:outer membrane protein assembly factor BamB
VGLEVPAPECYIPPGLTSPQILFITIISREKKFMSRTFVPLRSVLISLLCLLTALHPSVLAADWLTWGHDPQRSGWAREEKTLSPENVGTLELKWKTKVHNEPRALASLTAPLVATEVVTPQGIKTLVYVAGSSNNLHALDAESGAIVWTRQFKSYVAPTEKDHWLCPNNLNATPVIDRRAGTLYLITLDGKLLGVDLGTGKNKFGPVQFVPAFSKNWSLNLVDGVIYTSLSQGCGGGQSGLYAMDIRDPLRPVTYNLITSLRGGGIWGRGGPVVGTNGKVYGATGDGPWDPATGQYGSTFVAASAGQLKLVDYYTPRNWDQINLYDWDLGATSPVFFSWQNYRLLTMGAKEGVLYLMDADHLGDKDHHTPLYLTPRLANDEDTFEGKGIWGAPSAYVDEQGTGWVYVPILGPVSKHAPKFPLTNGDNPHGCVMAFKTAMNPATGKPRLEPAWISGDFNIPDPPVIANGVLFVLSTGENVTQTREGGIIFKQSKLSLLTNADRAGNTQRATLYALDARTGKVLYSSGDAMEKWVHFSGLAVANGRVYAVDWASNVYSFGLKSERKEAGKS